MQLSLEGIGVALSERDGYTVVEEVIPGGAADRIARCLKPKDKIIAVAEEDGEAGRRDRHGARATSSA